MEANVTENVAERRFQLPIGPEVVAAAYCRAKADRVSLMHTGVTSEYDGQGFASKLALGTFDLICKTGRRAVL